jgi:hypothetical protein
MARRSPNMEQIATNKLLLSVALVAVTDSTSILNPFRVFGNPWSSAWNGALMGPEGTRGDG